jgi:hypothetical protein
MTRRVSFNYVAGAGACLVVINDLFPVSNLIKTINH